MHIDTNAQNCNFLSVFVSLRGSLSCQWIVRCVVLSLPLYHSLSLFQYSYEWGGPEQGFPPDSWKMEKTISKLQGKKCELLSGIGSEKGNFTSLILGWGCLVRDARLCLSYLSILYRFLLIPRFLEGCKCDPIVCFHKQVSSHTANTQECQETSQPFSVNPHKHVVSPLSISGFWLNSTCQMTLKCHNHWDVFLCLRRPGSRGRREDDGRVIASLSSHRPWLAHVRPDYRSWCWWKVTLRLPAVCYQEPLDP